jgi:hypothetical protein
VHTCAEFADEAEKGTLVQAGCVENLLRIAEEALQAKEWSRGSAAMRCAFTIAALNIKGWTSGEPLCTGDNNSHAAPKIARRSVVQALLRLCDNARATPAADTVRVDALVLLVGSLRECYEEMWVEGSAIVNVLSTAVARMDGWSALGQLAALRGLTFVAAKASWNTALAEAGVAQTLVKICSDHFGTELHGLAFNCMSGMADAEDGSYTFMSQTLRKTQ